MHLLSKRLKEVGIILSLIEMDKGGYYVPEWKMIFVNQSLTEDDMKFVILHELKHALDHNEIRYLYNSFIYRYKMEKEANDFMLSEVIAENDGYYNASLIMAEFGLGIGNSFE